MAWSHHVRVPCVSSSGSVAGSSAANAGCSPHEGACGTHVPAEPTASHSMCHGRPVALTFLWRWDVSAQEGLKKAQDKGGK